MASSEYTKRLLPLFTFTIRHLLLAFAHCGPRWRWRGHLNSTSGDTDPVRAGAEQPNRLDACHGLATALCAAFAFLASYSSARAASHEQIIESCKQAHMEELRACVHGKVGNPKTAIGQARQACGGAIVRPCVLREEQKHAAGVAAPSAPKDAPAAAGDAPLEICTSFVAPPRTFADITAILDSEKPDEAQIANRKATADASPKGPTGPTLAQFLYDLAAACALLARNKDALARCLAGA